MTELRKPLYAIAVIAVALAVMLELGMALAGAPQAGSVAGLLPDGSLPGVAAADVARVKGESPAGSGTTYLALVDGLLLFTLVMIGLGALINQRAYGRVQGIVTLVVSFLWLLLALAMALLSLARLLLMIGLLLAVPFGTLAYLAIWGFFPTGKAALLLGALLFFKLVAVGFLVASQPRFLAIKGLVALIVVSIVLQLVLGLVQGWLPRVLVSIGDEVVALVTAVVALVWALVTLVVSIVAVVKALRVSASRSQ